MRLHRAPPFVGAGTPRSETNVLEFRPPGFFPKQKHTRAQKHATGLKMILSGCAFPCKSASLGIAPALTLDRSDLASRVFFFFEWIAPAGLAQSTDRRNKLSKRRRVNVAARTTWRGRAMTASVAGRRGTQGTQPPRRARAPWRGGWGGGLWVGGWGVLGGVRNRPLPGM